MKLITGTTKLLGVIGDPIKHSLSPVMHNAAIAALDLDYVYVALPVAPSDLATAIAGFAAIDLRGFSITIPHKQAIIPLLNQVSDVAQAIGAVNTVWRTEQGWSGTNTDVIGFLAPLKIYDRDWSQTTAVILGNGGAARAVVAGCAQLGCAAVKVVGRDRQKLAAFQQSWVTSPIPVELTIHAWEELPSLLPDAGLIVNSTPIGMHPHDQASPLEDAIATKIAAGAIAYDLIYTPSPTRFLRQAQQQEAIAIDGLEMLVQQGAAALEIWVGQTAPVEVMRQALRDYLGL
ncbi:MULTISPECIES: shikimate dehydrogenase [Trichocoleus]|uniref:Shikimate dehydrogenase (NADP(+)) n=1 Tax=Trichocoleus desertorum GB2-A4 TaxID=2933944 RepID=A0ABV0J1I4_9CYAN|nr:shikimate dehydrogenase [Trichocoleus sp. FACHB-46]MBD1860245.1 shikimate dehydrogenase [Trichocoleus sp. FACHB-46]